MDCFLLEYVSVALARRYLWSAIKIEVPHSKSAETLAARFSYW
jgi:hypothetical protein